MTNPKPPTCPRCASHRVQQIGLRRWMCIACKKRWSIRAPKKTSIISTTATRLSDNRFDVRVTVLENGKPISKSRRKDYLKWSKKQGKMSKELIVTRDLLGEAIKEARKRIRSKIPNKPHPHFEWRAKKEFGNVTGLGKKSS